MGLKELFSFSRQEVRGFILMFFAIFCAFIFPDVYSEVVNNDLKESDKQQGQVLVEGELRDSSAKKELPSHTISQISGKSIDSKTKRSKKVQLKSTSVKKTTFTGKEKMSINNAVKANITANKHISLKNNPQEKNTQYPHKKRWKSKIHVELNTADTTELKKVYGIGSWYSRKIARYRDRMGGFFSVNQLKEIKMREGTYERIAPQLYVDTTKVRKIDLDTIGFRNLLRHPYFDYEMVKKVFSLRRKKAHVSIKDLLNDGIISCEEYNIIKRYCKY